MHANPLHPTLRATIFPTNLKHGREKNGELHTIMARQQCSVTVRLREMVLNGSFQPGQHIAESQMAKILGVSRTPVRLALAALEHEGLVSGAPNRGFTVSSFSLREIGDAIDVRSALKGMAARLVAEAGLSSNVAAELRRCLEAGDAILAKGHVGRAEAGDYEAMNVRFHAAIIDAAENQALSNALSLNDKVPFASAGAVAFQDAANAYQTFVLGHGQHHAIVDALENGEGARAEALMREHALIAKKSLNLLELLREGAGPVDVPGLHLVRG